MISVRIMRQALLWFGLSLTLWLSGCSVLGFEPDPVAPLAEESAPVIKLPPLISDAKSARTAYVAEGNGRLYMCALDGSNNLTNCSVTGTTEQGIKPAWLPNYITFDTQNGIDYAYVVSAQNIFVCNLAADKNLINCHTTGSVDQYSSTVKWLPTNIRFAAEIAATYAYVTGVSTVYRCGLDSQGGLTGCHATGTGKAKNPMHWLPNGIALNRSGQSTYAYVTSSNRLYQWTAMPIWAPVLKPEPTVPKQQ